MLGFGEQSAVQLGMRPYDSSVSRSRSCSVLFKSGNKLVSSWKAQPFKSRLRQYFSTSFLTFLYFKDEEKCGRDAGPGTLLISYFVPISHILSIV